MTVIAVIVFVSLYFVEAGYGMLVSARWGKLINNKVAWFFMEFPIFAAMVVLWLMSPHRFAIQAWANSCSESAMMRPGNASRKNTSIPFGSRKNSSI